MLVLELFWLECHSPRSNYSVFLKRKTSLYPNFCYKTELDWFGYDLILQLPNGEANINDRWWFIETSAYPDIFLLCKSFDLKRERIMLQVFILMLIIWF